MAAIDKYSLLSIAPNVVIILGYVAFVVVGISVLHKNIAKDGAGAMLGMSGEAGAN